MPTHKVRLRLKKSIHEVRNMKKSPVILILSLVAIASINSLFADEITLGLRTVPPYVMQDASGKLSGMEYDIIAAALAVKKHTVKVEIFPLARVIESSKAGTIMAAAPLLPSHNTGRFLSDVYLTYNNIALGMKSKNLKVEKISDLKGKAVVAFQRATVVLGTEFETAMAGNSRYQEEANQAVQIKMLFSDRVDFAIGEARILKYFIFDPATSVDSKLPVVEYKVFPPTDYRVAFLNQKHMSDFNEGLATIKANGTYDKILAKYSSK